MIYAENQLDKVAHLIGPEIEWFLLGGPADANEAQRLHELRPDIRIIGFEPNPVMFQIQQDRGFPGTLLPGALDRYDATRNLITNPSGSDPLQRQRSSSIVKFSRGESQTVVCRSLDSLSKEYGPFNNSFLWIDIEGAELACLKGAQELLGHNQIRLISVEVFSDHVQSIGSLLGKFGYREILRWNHHVDEANRREWWDICYGI